MILEPVVSENEIDFGFIKVHSKKLAKHLHNCERVILFAATIGIEADRAVMRVSRKEPSFALALQAAGAAAIEAYCDLLCDTVFREEAKKFNLHPGKRFSPGYGDFDLQHQKKILSVLKCAEKIGLTLTDGCMLLPSKSVTAFVGLHSDEVCVDYKCSTCENINCAYRSRQ